MNGWNVVQYDTDSYSFCQVLSDYQTIPWIKIVCKHFYDDLDVI